MNVGIDKLQLYFGLDRFIVKDMNLFDQTIHKKRGQKTEVWAKDRHGNEITGNLFVNPDKKSGQLVGLDMNRKGLIVTFNPSKFFHPYHLLEVENLDQCLDVVHGALNKHGIALGQDLTDAAITRIDLAKQAQTKLPAGMYGSVLMSTVHAKRERNTALYPDGYKTGNNTRSVTLYDKTAERKLNGITDVPSNLTRLEARYRGKLSISNTKNNGLGLGTFEDALNAKTSYLNEKYNSYLREDIFRVQPNGIQMDLPFEIGNHYALIEVMFDQAENEAKAKGKKHVPYLRTVNGLFEHNGMQPSIKNGFVDALNMFLKQRESIPRPTEYRLRKHVERKIQQHASIAERAKSVESSMLQNRNYLLKLFAA